MCASCLEGYVVAIFENTVMEEAGAAQIPCLTCRAQVAFEQDRQSGRITVLMLYMLSISLFLETTMRRAGIHLDRIPDGERGGNLSYKG